MFRGRLIPHLGRLRGAIPLTRRSVRDFSNLGALTCIQVANALVPVVIVPFALHVIGAAGYAELAITESISFLVLAVVLFSFEVDGVAQVVGRDAERYRLELSEVVSGIVGTRLLLFVIAASLSVGVYSLLTGRSPLLLSLWMLGPFGQVFYSYWFYQGTENNIAPAAITLFARLCSVVIVFLTVHGPADEHLIPLGIGAPFAIGGILSLSYMCWRFGLRLHWPRPAIVLRLLRDGKEIFIGNTAVVMYREMNVMLLGIVGAAPQAIASYSLAEKSVKMLQAATRPLSQLFFPKVLRALEGQSAPSAKAGRLIARFTIPQLGAVCALFVILALGYRIAVNYWPLLQSFRNLPHLGLLLAIMAPATLFGIANFMFGVAGLNYLNRRVFLFKAIVATGVISAVSCLMLSKVIGALGAGVCFVGAEMLLLSLVSSRYWGRTREIERAIS